MPAESCEKCNFLFSTEHFLHGVCSVVIECKFELYKIENRKRTMKRRCSQLENNNNST